MNENNVIMVAGYAVAYPAWVGAAVYVGPDDRAMAIAIARHNDKRYAEVADCEQPHGAPFMVHHRQAAREAAIVWEALGCPF